MKTTFLTCLRAADEYFGGELDALIEMVLRHDLLLFVRIDAAGALLAPSGTTGAPDPTTAQRVWLTGFYAVAWPRSRAALAGIPQIIEWLWYRAREHPSFLKHPEPLPHCDIRAWIDPKRTSPAPLYLHQPQVLIARNHLEETLARASAAEATPWPWGDYQTPLLAHLREAAQRFWAAYDPSQPYAAPKKAEVVAWLVSRKVSERTAEQIDTILRSPDLPKGPRSGKR